jgi:hypothetical protein
MGGQSLGSPIGKRYGPYHSGKHYRAAVLIPFLFILSFHINFLLTSTGRTGGPMSMVEDSNDAFPPKEVPFWYLSERI